MADPKRGLVVYMDNNRTNKILSDIIEYLFLEWEDDQVHLYMQKKYDNNITDNEIGMALVQGVNLKLIKDRVDRAGGHHFSLGEEAHKILSIHGSYLKYIENLQNELVYQKKIQLLKLQNMVLVNMKLRILIIASVASFITGILVSDPIKRICQQLVSTLG